MSALESGRTLTEATKAYATTVSAFTWIQVLTAIGLVLATGVAVLTYPAETVFVWVASTAEALSGGDLALAFLLGVGAVLVGGVAFATTLLALCSALATAAITGIVDADANGNDRESAHPLGSFRAAAAGIWRAKRAIPGIVLITGVLGLVVVVSDRRREVLSERLGGIGRLLGASPGTFAHLAIPIAATEGGGPRHALRASRRRLVDASGNDVLATPGIVPTAGTTWIVPGFLGSMIGFAALALYHGSPDAVPDTHVLLIAIPLVLGALIGTTRAVVLQSTFRAALSHNLQHTTDRPQRQPTNPTPIIADHEATIRDAYTPARPDAAADHAHETPDTTAQNKTTD